MPNYITVQELQAFARESDGLGSEAAWELLADAASETFDALCEVERGFFAAAGPLATEKTFYGSGTAYLRLSPYVPGSLDLEGATMGEVGDTEALPEFVTAKGEPGLQYLVDRSATEQSDAYDADLGRNRFVGFPEALPINIEARWGWETTPADVRMAVVALALYMWRQSDPSFSSIANSDTNLILRELPPSVVQPVMRYRQKFSTREVFA